MGAAVADRDRKAPVRGASRTGRLVTVAFLLFALTCAYRFLTLGGALGGFDDDQFVNLSYAQQLVLGDRPTRDFMEPGRPLTHVLSAAAQMAIGHTLLAEAVFTIFMLAVSTALLFLLAERASGSISIAAAVALIQIAMAPRYYNYPKLLAYALAIPAMWWYINRPSRWRLFWVAVAGAIAFLLRHDHGAYVGVAALVAVVAAHWPDLRRGATEVAVLGLMALVLVGPYFAYTQRYENVFAYLRAGVAFAERTADRTDLQLPHFAFDSSLPLITRDPPKEPPVGRRARAMAMVTQFSILPGYLREENAIPFLYYFLVITPVLVLGLVLIRGDKISPVAWNRPALKIGLVAVLALVMTYGLLRGNLASRLVDVSEVAGILIAWLAAVLMTQRSALARAMAGFVVITVFVLSALSVQALEHVTSQINIIGVPHGPLGIVAHARDIYPQLTATPPVAAWSDRPGSVRLTRYVHACTMATDRVLMLGYTPELFFMAQRGFAAGSPWILPEFFTSPEEQRVMISRIKAHRTPIVLTVPEPDYTDDYVSSFPLLDQLLRSEYRDAGTADFGEGRKFRVLVRRDLVPSGTYASLGLPCFSK